MESVYFNNNRNNKDDITYSPQNVLEERRYIPMNSRRLLIDNIKLTDNEPNSESESEEEFNENSV